MAKQKVRRGLILQDIFGKACSFCGGESYHLVIGSIRRLGDSILLLRCRRCNHPRSFDAELKRLLWIHSTTCIWAMLLTITETIRRPLHHLQTHVDHQHKNRSTLEMLTLSGAVRPSHVELRYTTPLLTVEGSHHPHQDATAPATKQSSLMTQFMEFIQQLVMDLRSLRPYIDRGLSSLGAALESRTRRFSVLPSPSTVVVEEGNGYPAKAEPVSQAIVEARAAGDHEPTQWVRQNMLAQLDQIVEEEANTITLGSDEQHNNVVVVDLPIASQNAQELPQPTPVMGGTVTVLRPGVWDLVERFESKVLPLLSHQPRKTDSTLPEPYVQGLSTGDFDVALRNLLGEEAPLSESLLQQLKSHFTHDYDMWAKRDLSHLAVAYWWADGLYVKAGLEDRKRTLLTIVGVLTTGEKVVLACESGDRESKGSWLKLLRDLKQRGLTFPLLTVADGNLGLWAALNEIHSSGETQGCWNYKIKNVLHALPKQAHSKARELLKAMPYAETQTECERRRDEFVRTYGETERNAVDRLLQDWERMVTFYAFPQEHWRHIRTTNIVSLPFTSARIRTNSSRRYTRIEGAKVMMWKMLQVAEGSWRKIPAPELLPLVAFSTFNIGSTRQSARIESAVNYQAERPAA